MYIFWVRLRRVAGHFAFVSIKFPLKVRPGFIRIVPVLFFCIYVCHKRTKLKNSARKNTQNWCELLLHVPLRIMQREREEDREERIMSKCHLYIFNFHHRYVFATQKPQFAYYGTARRRGKNEELPPS